MLQPIAQRVENMTNSGDTVFWLLMAGTLLYFALALALSLIDFRSQLLPDRLTLPLLWLGLLFHCLMDPRTVDDAVYGAAAGYLSLWVVFQLFRWKTGREGLGYGDFKLLAAIGAWNSWQSLPVVITAASLLGLASVGFIYIAKQRLLKTIPFGPYLAAAGWGEFVWQAFW
ncbi:prepilin peptidase [Cedecea davisae]|uniref:Type 4 prepilin-like protein leader peptide-processing enzyme domain protein n=1 Tax=Cedecea davisae DSM 4568 TaxID=566551 RepID=S3IJN7_9ENTR|nr:A24 family peptidase [Cedecea davisae]EPF13280.1 type 4 prepilin-like protein leader peptide-processing enzyme domain protein [Cedecea davisae DSM 4568]